MPRRFVKSTIKDVAAHAGVSVTTVSCFVNGRAGSCSVETAERIRQAIADLHYVPGPTVRGARQTATRTIGVCVESSADLDEASDPRNSYQERVWRAIIRESDAARYMLMHYPADIRHGQSADAFLNGRIDGLLLGARRGDERPHTVVAAGLPTVVLSRATRLPAGCGAVYANEADTANLALSHLWELGHRRIAHLAGPVELPLAGYDGVLPVPLARLAGDPEATPSDAATRRCESYIVWMRARDAYDPALLAFAPSWFWGDADRALEAWRALPDPPTAVWCANDEIALQLIQAARGRHGLSVPEDLSVAGVDNRSVGADQTPSLTSVDIPAERMGQEAMRLLIRLMEGGKSEPIQIALPITRLIARASSAAPRLTQRKVSQ